MSDEKISIVLPTRGRPIFMQRLWNSIFDLALKKDLVEIVFYIDDDDLESIECAKQMNESNPNVIYIIGPRICISIAWNKAYELASGDIIMHCGDDIIFRTSGWDELVRDEFEKYKDRIVLVYGHDGYCNGALATHSFIHRRWIEVVGYFLPPYFESDFNDVWLDELATRIERRVFLPQLYTEHMHYVNGKAEKDQNTFDRLERHKQTHPDEIYKSKITERIQDADKLSMYIYKQFTPGYYRGIRTTPKRKNIEFKLKDGLDIREDDL
jgi:glycosyltransferase involved in cell wall biosynthesis